MDLDYVYTLMQITTICGDWSTPINCSLIGKPDEDSNGYLPLFSVALTLYFSLWNSMCWNLMIAATGLRPTIVSKLLRETILGNCWSWWVQHLGDHQFSQIYPVHCMLLISPFVLVLCREL